MDEDNVVCRGNPLDGGGDGDVRRGRRRGDEAALSPGSGRGEELCPPSWLGKGSRALEEWKWCADSTLQTAVVSMVPREAIAEVGTNQVHPRNL